MQDFYSLCTLRFVYKSLFPRRIMTEKFINIDLDDPRSEHIAEVLSNKTCKKILSFLADKEMSASDLARELSLPLNTIGYNLEKLVAAGLIEKSKSFFWSSRGKRIERYSLSNKKIVISPKRMFGSVLPVLAISGVIALGIKFFSDHLFTASAPSVSKDLMREAPSVAEGVLTKTMGATAPFAANINDSVTSASSLVAENLSPVPHAASSSFTAIAPLAHSGFFWLWFLLGAFVALFIYVLWNWRRL